MVFGVYPWRDLTEWECSLEIARGRRIDAFSILSVDSFTVSKPKAVRCPHNYFRLSYANITIINMQ